MARYYAGFLHGIRPDDAQTFAVVPLFLLAVAIMSRLISRLTANRKQS